MSVQAPQASLASPYKGLAPFDDTDADALLFFGREWETEVVAANVLAARLTVLYGPSGVGKSSLLRAGVVRAVRQSGQPSPAVAVFGTWADDPLAGLEGAARAAVAEVLGRDPTDAPGGLTDRLAAWSAELGAELCLLVDQLEELFLYHPAKEGAAGFVDLLPELVLRPGLRVNVLLGVRDDALAQLDVFKERIPGLFMNSLRLDHLDRRAAREAILGPLARFATIAGAAGAMEIEPELVDEVLDEVAAGRIEPSISGVGAVEGTARAGRIETPYLQLVLQRLWEVERERGSRVLRLETFRSLGGAEQIVQSHLERALRSLSPAEQAAAASVFGHLVTPSGTKIAHGTADLATYAALDEREIKPVLDTLARQRILRPLGENGHVGDRYEIFHDVLAGAVLAWRTRHESDAALEEERKRRRRFGWIAVVALVGLVLMSGLAAYAWSQRAHAREQTAAANEARIDAENAQQDLETSNQDLKRIGGKLKTSNESLKNETARADHKAQQATDAKEDAVHEADIARYHKRRADHLAHELRAELRIAQAGEVTQRKLRVAAESAEHTADVLRRDAEQKTEQARAAGRRAEARSYISRSLRELERDPQASMKAAAAASELAVRDDDQLDAENALRAALVALRVTHILSAAGAGGAKYASLSAHGRRPGLDAARVARFSANGRRIVVGVGPNARALRVFRARDAKLLRTFTAGTVVQDVALSRDGRFVAAAGADGRVWVWDVDAGTPRQFTHGDPVSAVIWSPTADVLVSIGGTSALLWDVANGEKRSLLPQRDPLKGAVFSRDGQRVATYGEGRFVRVFDVSTAIRISTLPYPAGPFPVTSAAFGPQGDVIATGRGNQARLWEIATSDTLMTFTGQRAAVTDVALSATGQHLATGSLDTVARVFTTRTGIPEDTYYGHTGLGINDIDFSPQHEPGKDSTAIVSAGADGTARFADQGQLPVPLLGHDRAVLHASFSPDGNTVLTSSKDGTARVWDPYGEPLPKVIASYGKSLTSLAVDPTRSLVAVGTGDGAVDVISMAGRTISNPLSAGPPVVSVAWARGRKLMVATADGHVRVWDDAGTSLARSVDQGGPINGAAISPDGTEIATAGAGKSGETHLWRPSSERPRVLGGRGPVNAVAFSPNGRILATASGQAAITWATADGARLKVFQPEGATDDVTALAFRPSGDLLATADGALVRTWTVASGHLRKTFIHHGSRVQAVAFSPDGRWLASVAARKAAIWQIGDSDLDGNFLFFVAPPLVNQKPLTSVAFTGDHTIVMSNNVGRVLKYQCEFCGRLPRLVGLAKEKLERLDREAKQ